MANRDSFTSNEWLLLRDTPFLTGLVVVTSDPSGPIGVLKEAAAVTGMILKHMDGYSSELLRALSEDLHKNFHMPGLESKAPEWIRATGLNSCRDAIKLIKEKGSMQEAAEYRAWLVALSEGVAHASKEGGFLGIGGIRVSDHEQQALQDIKTALA